MSKLGTRKLQRLFNENPTHSVYDSLSYWKPIGEQLILFIILFPNLFYWKWTLEYISI